MAGPEPLILPEIPSTLKKVEPYLKIATNHEQRDNVISYWCRLYALQTGLKLSTKTNEETAFLLKLMDWLESTKKANSDNDAITNDIAAQAHVENYALKLFLYADKNDRQSNFSKNVILSFYTAGLLYDVLTTFGELSEEAVQNRKYSKWKATYINNCLKNGETPVPGPAKEDDDENSNENAADSLGLGTIKQEPGPSTMPTMPYYPMQPLIPSQPIPTPPVNMSPFEFPSVPAAEKEDDEADENSESIENTENIENSDPHSYNPVQPPANPVASMPYVDPTAAVKSEGGVTLSLDQSSKAQKYIKWAGSALNYDDVPTAITNLQKALHLLTTGQDPA